MRSGVDERGRRPVENKGDNAWSPSHPELLPVQREPTSHPKALESDGVSASFLQDLLFRWGFMQLQRQCEQLTSARPLLRQPLSPEVASSTAFSLQPTELNGDSETHCLRVITCRTRRRPVAFLDLTALKAVTDSALSRQEKHLASSSCSSGLGCAKAEAEVDTAVARGIAAGQCAAGRALCLRVNRLEDRVRSASKDFHPIPAGHSPGPEQGEYGALLQFLKACSPSELFVQESCFDNPSPPWDPTGLFSTQGGLAKSFEKATEQVVAQAFEALKQLSGCPPDDAKDCRAGYAADSWLQVQSPITPAMVETFLRVHGRPPPCLPTRAAPQRAHLQLQLIQQQLLEQHHQLRRREHQRLELERLKTPSACKGSETRPQERAAGSFSNGKASGLRGPG